MRLTKASVEVIGYTSAAAVSVIVTILFLVLVMMMAGCDSGLRRHPDAPMLIDRVWFDQVKVSVWDEDANSLVSYGWVKIPQGWTLHKFDWEEFANGESRNQAR